MMAGVEKDYSEQPEAIGRGKEKAVMGLFHGIADLRRGYEPGRVQCSGLGRGSI